MEFHVRAFDGNDYGAKDRRLKVRGQHLELMRQLLDKGHFINGGAILNDAGEMIGSTLYMDFPSRQELDQWLMTDPYVIGKVWRHITVEPIKLVRSSDRPSRDRAIGALETIDG